MTLRLRLLLALSVVLASVGLGGAAIMTERASSGDRQKWTDFDSPPWTDGIDIGRTYEYSVYAHCGVHVARIDGTNWRADPPLDDGMGNPPRGWEKVSGVGKLKIVDANTAVFENEGLEIRFVRDDLPDAPCS